MLGLITEDVGFAGSELPEPTLQQEAQEWLRRNADKLQLWEETEGECSVVTEVGTIYLQMVEKNKML